MRLPSTIVRLRARVHNILSSASATMETTHQFAALSPTQEEIDEESRRIRRLRILVRLTLDTIAAGGLSAEEAARMVAATRRAALEMFPGKERVFDLIYRPQFQRMMHAVYRLQ
jgi:hypothetical protein